MKALSFIPKTLHQIYSAFAAMVVSVIWIVGAMGLVVAGLGWVLYAIVGFIVSAALSILISIPNRLFLRWARAWDPVYMQDKLDALQSVAKKASDAVPDEIGGTTITGDLTDLVAATASGRKGSSKWAKDSE